MLGPPPRFVGRGGEKLDGALERFGVDVDGRRALDLGASTGGFTDCLLQRGARSRGGRRRRATASCTSGCGPTPGSTSTSAPTSATSRPDDLGPAGRRRGGRPVVHLAAHGAARRRCRSRPRRADLVLLVKPQFEAGRQEAARGKGVITDPAIWRRVLEEVACRARGPRSRHHGGHGVSAHRRRRQRRVPPPRPHGRRRSLRRRPRPWSTPPSPRRRHRR